ncbi:MAG: hypothetical protein KatS3mg060_3444 [Dehalococcoidia bacterium]|nr:MAG: hypothetical protein KatS3mg060_3444 [Dehalococcoidia bacterium]
MVGLVGTLLLGPVPAHANRADASASATAPFSAAALPPAQLPTAAPAATLPTDRVIVRFREGMGSQSSGVRTLGVQVLREDHASGVTVLAVNPRDVPSILGQLAALPEVEYAEPDYRVGILEGPTAQDSDDSRVLTSGVPISGTISPATDLDTYYFDAMAGQRITIRMTRQTAPLDPFLRLYSPTGSLLAWDDDSGGNLNSLIPNVTLAISGRYRIEAFSYFGMSAGPYELVATLDSPPTATATRTATPTGTPGSPTPSATVPAGAVVTPNDPAFVQQYGLQRIRGPQGWALSTGREDVIIAVVDTGVDLSHPDLAGKIVGGWDFVNDDPIAQDDQGHGTHVAGIAAGIANNALGIAGVAWGARVMPIKVLDAGGSGYTSDVAAGIIWAADHGAKVINLSLGGAGRSVTLETAVNYAVAKGALVVAAAGNGGNSVPNYPGAYPAAIAVAATDSSNARASFSTYGSFVDIAAPGVSIYATVPTGSCDLCHGSGYAALSGTSMATPHVAGVAAVLAGLPEYSTPAHIRSAIEGAALDLGAPGRDDFYGFGLVQLDAAIRFLAPGSTTPTPPPTSSPTATRTPLPPTPPTASPTPSRTPLLPTPATPSPSPTWAPIPPSFTRLRPTQGLTSEPVDVVIEGRGLSSATVAVLRHAKAGTRVPLVGVRAFDTTRLLGSIPATIDSGAYDLLLTNPGTPETVIRNVYLAVDPVSDDFFVEPADIWSLPARPYVGTEAELGVNIRRRGAGPSVLLPVRFYQGDPDGGRLLADLAVTFESRSRFAWLSTPWAVGPAAGPISITVVLDPDGTVPETSTANNRASRTFAILGGGGDTVAPVAASLVASDGAPAVADPTVGLELHAYDPPGGSGLALMMLIERVLNPASGTWTPVQTTRWLPFSASPTLTLAPGAGARTIQAFVADAAGNVSLRPAVARFDFLPASDSLLSGQTRIFRRLVRAGETISVRLTPESGDPDLYIWDPRGRRALVRNASGLEIDEGSVVASLTGYYQIEVEAYTDTTYSIAITASSASLRGLSEEPGPNAAKPPPRTSAAVDVTLEPEDGFAFPELPERRETGRLAIPAAFNRDALER